MSQSNHRAFLFSGQGAQKVGMGSDLQEKSEAARALYSHADSLLGWPLAALSARGPATKLTETSVCQPALYVHGLALLRAAQEMLGKPLSFEAAAGLSLGEYTAHAAAGSFSFETGLRLVARRGHLMQLACERTSGLMMVILGASEEQANALAQAADVDVANINCPGQIVLSGEKDQMERLPALAKEMGLRRVVALNVAGAYHSRLMAEAAASLAPDIEKAEIVRPRVPVIANFTAEESIDPPQIRADLLAQVCGAVRWESSLRKLISSGVNEFVEFGPGAVLAGLIKRIDPNLSVFSLENYADLVKHADVLN